MEGGRDRQRKWGASPTQTEGTFGKGRQLPVGSPPFLCGDSSLVAAISPALFITDKKIGWDAGTRGQDNPGNNMRTLSLSRTLTVDLHCCRLP